jgi:hypothetical protein
MLSRDAPAIAMCEANRWRSWWKWQAGTSTRLQLGPTLFRTYGFTSRGSLRIRTFYVQTPGRSMYVRKTGKIRAVRYNAKSHAKDECRSAGAPGAPPGAG